MPAICILSDDFLQRYPDPPYKEIKYDRGKNGKKARPYLILDLNTFFDDEEQVLPDGYVFAIPLAHFTNPNQINFMRYGKFGIDYTHPQQKVAGLDYYKSLIVQNGDLWRANPISTQQYNHIRLHLTAIAEDAKTVLQKFLDGIYIHNCTLPYFKNLFSHN